MIVTDYLARQYTQPGCWELVTDVYLRELQSDVLAFATVNNSVRAIANTFRLALHKDQHGFVQIAEPAPFCVVLMGKSLSLGLHHCGVYYEGSVLHAKPNLSLYQDMASLKSEYALIEYWAKPGVTAK